MAVAEGIAALNSLKSLYEIAKDVRNSNDPEKLRAAAAQMFDLALAAREQTAALQDDRNKGLLEIADLKKRVSRFEEWEDEKTRYQLQTVYPGSFAYALRPEAENTEPPHWLCPTCFQERKKAILQRGKHGGMYTEFYFWNCQVCKTEMKVSQDHGPANPWRGNEV